MNVTKKGTLFTELSCCLLTVQQLPAGTYFNHPLQLSALFFKDMSDDLDDLNFLNHKKKKKKTRKDKKFDSELEEGMKVRILVHSVKLCCIMGMSSNLSVEYLFYLNLG